MCQLCLKLISYSIDKIVLPYCKRNVVWGNFLSNRKKRLNKVWESIK